MKLSIVSCRVANLSPPGFQYANYVLQMDVNYHKSRLGLEFRFWNRAPKSEGMGDMNYYILSPGGLSFFQTNKTNNRGAAIPLYIPRHIFDPSEPVTITIISQNPNIIIYVDSTILVAYDKLESYQGPWEMDFTVNSWDTTPTEYLMLELDNVRIWDLDKRE